IQDVGENPDGLNRMVVIEAQGRHERLRSGFDPVLSRAAVSGRERRTPFYNKVPWLQGGWTCHPHPS
ncbi:MAG TPA: hypothetical protein VEX87_11405, partial [Skermanella sp.]|nr:hypothetical protein [Skermanella sp.]